MGFDQLGQRDMSLDGVAHQSTDDDMGLPKRHAALDQPFGQVDGSRERGIGGGAHPGRVPGDGRHHACHGPKPGVHLFEGIEQRLFVLLKVRGYTPAAVL